MNKVQVKVSGKPEAVKQFLSVIDKLFEFKIESKLLNNRTGSGVHCFIDLDPHVLKEQKSNG